VSARLRNPPAAPRYVNSVAPAAWPAVFAMGLGVFGLVGAEFLPASLLTPMAADLGVSEGMAGQAVTATAAAGLLASLAVPALTRRVDRRRVLLALSVLLVAANLMVAAAPGLGVLLAGRLLLGVALGGFWALATATVMRLVPEASVPKALAIVVSGVSAATVFAAPVGSWLGDLLGWRAVFVAAAGLGLVVLAVQAATLPALPSRGRSSFAALGRLVVQPRIAVAMLAALLVFTGQFGLFTYIRPFLEGVSGATAAAVPAVLLGFGIANFAGNYLGGFLLRRSMRLTLAAAPLAIAVLAAVLAGLGGDLAADAVLVALWGLAFGTVPVAWSAWIAHAAPEQAESAGGLLVATINLAIATGAAAGGLVLDASGVQAVFWVSGGLLALAAAVVVLGVRTEVAGRDAG